MIASAAVLVMVWAPVNLAYHVIRKPTELFLPVSGALAKPPAETWRHYGSLFRRYATSNVTPELLASLAQIESAGDPIARTYWRWRFSWNPLDLYQPASSAVGLYQMTDPAFAEARRSCIHDHRVVEEGPWYDVRACWLNGLYTRIIPSDAVELTAIYLDRKLASLAAHKHLETATKQEKENLAALIHLCGAGPAEAYLRRGFRLAPGERCGDHDAALYLARVTAMNQQFHRFANADERLAGS
jgi:hypothetical protein